MDQRRQQATQELEQGHATPPDPVPMDASSSSKVAHQVFLLDDDNDVDLEEEDEVDRAEAAVEEAVGDARAATAVREGSLERMN